MTKPIFKFSGISKSSTNLEVANKTLEQNYPVVLLREMFTTFIPLEGAPHVIRGLSPYQHLLDDVSVAIGIPTGPPGTPIWRVCTETKSLVEIKGLPTPTPARIERSTEFLPRRTPSTQAPQAQRVKLKRTYSAASEELLKIRSKIDDLKHTVSRHAALVEASGDLRREVQQKEAESLVADTLADVTAEMHRLDELDIQIQDSKRDAAAASGAIKILQKRADSIASVLPKLHEEEREAETALLTAKREQLFEKLRLELHSLHGCIADILAIEAASNFHGHADGWEFVESISMSLPVHSRVRPDWFDTSRPNRFPGFSAASAALDAELNAIGDQA